MLTIYCCVYFAAIFSCGKMLRIILKFHPVLSLSYSFVLSLVDVWRVESWISSKRERNLHSQIISILIFYFCNVLMRDIHISLATTMEFITVLLLASLYEFHHYFHNVYYSNNENYTSEIIFSPLSLKRAIKSWVN